VTATRLFLRGLITAFIALAATAAPLPGRGAVPLVVDGERLYRIHCAVCHGERGDGRGPAAARLTVRPRDLRSGKFKFRSTPSGSLPTDEDLEATLIHGVRGTGMVPQTHLNADERRAAIAYLKTFSERFTNEQPQMPVEVPRPPRATPDVVARGQRLYRKAQCAECHGDEGRGDGPSAATMKDDSGLPIAVPDLTRWPRKRGHEPEAVFRTIATGLSGTPMPSYSDALDPEEIWAVVWYIESLIPQEHREPLDQLFPGEERLGDRIEAESRRPPER
jgi:mono/diheme cytochrome c family protein